MSHRYMYSVQYICCVNDHIIITSVNCCKVVGHYKTCLWECWRFWAVCACAQVNIASKSFKLFIAVLFRQDHWIETYGSSFVCSVIADTQVLGLAEEWRLPVFGGDRQWGSNSRPSSLEVNALLLSQLSGCGLHTRQQKGSEWMCDSEWSDLFLLLHLK
jgi:hypothetical protein